MNSNLGFSFDNSYLSLPSVFYSQIGLNPVSDPKLAIFNDELALDLGLSPEMLKSPDGINVLSGNITPSGGAAIAQAYAGHQFGHFTFLGDGRAMLIGEQITPQGERFDIQLKGSGVTPYSRRGDGKAALGPMLREYIISEAMHALGIDSTRSLSVVTTGEKVYRDRVLRGAVLARVAKSHLRVGTFQYASATGNTDYVKALADYAIERHYPYVKNEDNPYIAFYREVLTRQARLIAKWQAVGFIHGVMNTDNMTISGETIDYGPCAFMDAYHSKTVFSSIDSAGRYSYGNQPGIGQWNLARFAESLLSLFDFEQKTAIKLAEEELTNYKTVFEDALLSNMKKKLGLTLADDSDSKLISVLLALMEKHSADFTNTFLDLTFGRQSDSPLYSDADFSDWKVRYNNRLRLEAKSKIEIKDLMKSANPAVIPRNHRVEKALSLADIDNDLSEFNNLLTALKNPYAHTPEQREYEKLPEPDGIPYRTFCGT
ncbi:MAG: YdiU family protein [Ruminococcaceae bacterium]|nr:YdiU family protein [Oscillospiraceae bacterium]